MWFSKTQQWRGLQAREPLNHMNHAFLLIYTKNSIKTEQIKNDRRIITINGRATHRNT